MTGKEHRRRTAYDALGILGLLAALTFICRLWPILLLIILGIFVAALRLLFTASREVSVPDAEYEELDEDPQEPDLEALLFAEIQTGISAQVKADYPDAQWVWECANPRQRIREGKELFVILDRAGGFRRARVILSALGVKRLEYPGDAQPSDNPGPPAKEEPPANPQPETPPEPPRENYELTAFEWVDAHLLELNSRCNEAIGQSLSSILIPASELPAPESWESICAELRRNEVKDVQPVTEGIQINLTH